MSEVVTTEVVEQEDIQEEVETVEEVQQEEEQQVDSELDETDPSDKDEKGKPRKQNGFQKRVSKLTSQREEAKREAEYWRKVALEKGDPKPKNDDAPKESTGKPNPDSFDTHDEYIEALVDWKADQKISLQKEEVKKSESQKVAQKQAESWQGKVNEFMAKVPDFEEVMDDAPNVKLANEVTHAIFDSELGPAILYDLAKNEDEAVRISKLSPLAAIREIGKIEARLQGEKPRQVKKTTNAPAPINTLRGSGKVQKSIYDRDISQAEYEALREKQMANKA